MAVRRRLCYGARRERAASAGLVDQNCLLTPKLAKCFGHHSHGDIGTTAGALLRDEPDRAGGISLSRRGCCGD